MHDSFYTPGEGIGGLNITAVRAGDGATFSTTTFDSGGYSLRLQPGSYTVTASGGSISPVVYSNVMIASTNVKRDFIPSGDVTRPKASAGTFLYETAPLRLTIKFSESVSASLSAGDLQLQRIGIGTLIPVTLAGYSSTTNVATFGVSDLLADGIYRATLPAGSVKDVAGNALASSYTLEFTVLAGDPNRDGVVDSLDFAQLAAHFNESGANFSAGDFNYDGVITSADSDALVSNFGKRFSVEASSSTPLAAARLVARMRPIDAMDQLRGLI